MVEELDGSHPAASYVFRNQYYFTDLPPDPNETSNITFLRHRLKVCDSTTACSCTVHGARQWTTILWEAFCVSTPRTDLPFLAYR